MCPIGDSKDGEVVDNFYRELVIHKPKFQKQHDKFIKDE